MRREDGRIVLSVGWIWDERQKNATIAVNSVTSTGWKEGWLRFGWSASLGPNLPCLASNKHVSPMFKENGSRMLQTSAAAQAWSAWSYLQCWVWGIFFSYCGTTISKCLVLGGSDSAFSSQNRTATGTRMLQMLLAHLRRECLVDCRSCRYGFWTRNTSWGKNTAHASWRLTNILTANRGSYFQVHFATAKHSSLCPVGFYGHRAFIINGKLKTHRTTTFVLSYCIHMWRGETQSVYCKCFFPKSVSLEPY